MRRLTWPISLAVALVIATPWTALADSLIADGDGVAPVASRRLDFGTVCLGRATDAVVLVAVNATNHPGPRNNVYASASPVFGGVESISVPQLSVTVSGDPVWTPADWQTIPNGTPAGMFSSTVTVVPDALGQFRGRVRYRADGVNGRNGNALTRYVNMQVRARVVDCDPPVLTMPSDVIVEATSQSGAVADFTAPTAMDDVSGPRPVTCDATSGDTFPLGLTTVTCTASDAAGNVASAAFGVSVVDTTAPSLADAPADQVVEATGPVGAVASYAAPTATDVVDGPLAVVCDIPSGSSFPLGGTIVTCVATDAAGNAAAAQFSISVVDTTAPTVPNVPADQAVEATGAGGAAVTFAVPASLDLVDGSVPVTCDATSGDTFPLGLTTVTCTASDAAGNVASAAFGVSVSVTPPTPEPEPEPEPEPILTPTDQPVVAPEETEQAVNPSRGGTGQEPATLPDTTMAIGSSVHGASGPMAVLGALTLVLGLACAARRPFRRSPSRC